MLPGPLLRRTRFSATLQLRILMSASKYKYNCEKLVVLFESANKCARMFTPKDIKSQISESKSKATVLKETNGTKPSV